MENEITAHKAGKIAELPISEGDSVTAGDTLAVITSELSCFDEAVDWLQIPSISAGERDEAALREAAEWAVERVLAAGGTCELVETAGGAPLVVGELRASARDDAPDGDDLRPLRRPGPGRSRRLDVAGVRADGPRRPRCTPAARPTTRATSSRCCTSRARWRAPATLPVHVRVLIEGAEETGSDDVGEWVRADERGADAVIVFDSGMVDADTPALTLATRGMVFAHVEIRTGTQPAHSGMYGGAALNAFHALHRVLSAVLPGPGRPPARAAARRGHPAVGGRDRELEDAARRRGRAGAGRRAAGRREGRRGVLRPHDGRAVAGRPPGRGRAGAHDRRAGGLAPTCRCGSSAASARRRSPPTSRRCCAARCPTAPS